jgi:hypothetical protein
MYIAKREGLLGGWDYFQDNINDSPKWTREKSKAAVFETKEEALAHSNVSGIYEIHLEELDDQ